MNELVFAAAGMICFAANNKVRRVVDVCLLTYAVWLVLDAIVTNIKFMHILLLALIYFLLSVVPFVVVCRGCIMR